MTGVRDIYKNVGLDDLPMVAKSIREKMDIVNVWLFVGDLGAGKTTLVKVLGEMIGVDDMMSSPSFSIVNEYHAADTGKVYHFDFYRIKSEMEAMDIGVDEYFDSGFPCLIEWPEKVPGLIPVRHGEVRLTIEDDNKRTIEIFVHDGKEKNRV